jgi:metal-responsive CopG/Arc/MetJ family transcriptional regulator
MSRSAAKIALSLPDDLFREIERARKIRRQSRSGLVQDALRLWLRQQSDTALVREWEEGYRRTPESPAEIESAKTTARFAFEAEDEW